MYNYKLTIQYDGSRYKGWQRLGGEEMTIQGKLENVLTELTGEDVEIVGCGRTDASVHALAQIANFKTTKKFNPKEIQGYLNHYLPQDIAVTNVVEVSEGFHARYNAINKTYLYKLWNEEHPNPFMRKYSLHITDKLNIGLMKEASEYFIGAHDFTAFTNAKSKKKSMVREIYSIDIAEADGFILIRIKGNGFLYNMVRRIVGTLVDVGLGKINPDDILDIIEAKQRAKTGNMAAAYGLFLESIEY